MALLEADVNFQVVKDFVRDVQEAALGEKVLSGLNPTQQIVGIVHEKLVHLLGDAAVPIKRAPNGPTIILMAGLQGSGKTTTCGKLALWLRKHKKKNPLLVAADLQRPAAVEQLQTLGKQLGIELK